MSDVLTRNKLRTALTAMSVAWGIFMLVLLLGFGTGLENNVHNMFKDDAANSIWVYSGKTSIPFKGRGIGRTVQLNNRDHNAVADSLDILHITSRFMPGDKVLTWENESGSYDIRTVHPDHKFLENTLMERGRYINERDLIERTRVAVLGRKVVEEIFGERDPIGEWIQLGGVGFRVVGTFRDEGADGEESIIYLPITTAQRAFAGGENVRQIMFMVDDVSPAASERYETQVRQLMARRHQFAPNDRKALRVRNNLEEYSNILQIFALINGFVWLVGLGTMSAGMVGVSNIMLVSVKERTQEIGLRKALGATPFSIVNMIVFEALLLTAVSGYAGLVAGIGTLEAIRYVVPENDYIKDPEVQLTVAIVATIVIIIAGAIAGLIPALRAASVNPIEALRSE